MTGAEGAKAQIAAKVESSGLLSGAKELAQGMAQFDESGIRRLADTYHGNVQQLLDRADAVVNAGSSYHTFTKLPDGMEGSVKFIIRTEPVEKK